MISLIPSCAFQVETLWKLIISCRPMSQGYNIGQVQQPDKVQVSFDIMLLHGKELLLHGISKDSLL